MCGDVQQRPCGIKPANVIYDQFGKNTDSNGGGGGGGGSFPSGFIGDFSAHR